MIWAIDSEVQEVECDGTYHYRVRASLSQRTFRPFVSLLSVGSVTKSVVKNLLTDPE